MLVKTQGIVISFIKFRETSIICRIYTEALGLQSYIVNGVRKHGKKTYMALYQPLCILDLVVLHKPQQSLHRINEIKSAYPFQSLFFQPVKMAIGLFISEVISKTIKEGEAHESAYVFLKHSIMELDCITDSFVNFHLAFLLQYAEYLGFKISSATDVLMVHKNYEKYVAEAEGAILLDHLIQHGYSTNDTVSNSHRRWVLDRLLNFYYTHFENIGEINSLKVLQEMNR